MSLAQAKNQLFNLAIKIAHALFAREVTIEGLPHKVRVLPVIWKGSLHLFGLHGNDFYVATEFTTPSMLRLVTPPKCPAGPSHPVEVSVATLRVAHVILCHLPAAKTEGLLDHARKMSDGYEVVLAYGGPQEEFDQIRHSEKMFIDDPSLRGRTLKINYDVLLSSLLNHYREKQAPDWIFIGDFDTVPLRHNYLEVSIAQALEHKKSFVANDLQDVTASNCCFITFNTDRRDLGWLSKDPRNRDIRVYHALGAALLFSWDCLQGIVENLDRFPRILFEVSVPTAAVLAGHQVMDMATSSEEWAQVRYRPLYPVSELERLQAEGVPLVHPVKDIDEFLKQAHSLQKRAFASKKTP